ncbi:hypothetical protein ACOSQ3_032495 [Xanthoceras sorbifolium]
MAELGGHPFYNCRNCLNPLAFSKASTTCENSIKEIKRSFCWGEEKQLISGVYTIANIYCSKCSQELGWYYPRAHDLKKDSRKAIL